MYLSYIFNYFSSKCLVMVLDQLYSRLSSTWGFRFVHYWNLSSKRLHRILYYSVTVNVFQHFSYHFPFPSSILSLLKMALCSSSPFGKLAQFCNSCKHLSCTSITEQCVSSVLPLHCQVCGTVPGIVESVLWKNVILSPGWNR